MMPLDSDGQNDLGHTALAGGPDVHQPVRMAGRHGPTDEPAREIAILGFCGRRSPRVSGRAQAAAKAAFLAIARGPRLRKTPCWRKGDSNLYGAFLSSGVFGLLRVLCSERKGRSSSRRLRSGSRSTRRDDGQETGPSSKLQCLTAPVWVMIRGELAIGAHFRAAHLYAVGPFGS